MDSVHPRGSAAFVTAVLLACFASAHSCQVVVRFDLSRPFCFDLGYLIDLEFEDYSPNLHDH